MKTEEIIGKGKWITTARAEDFTKMEPAIYLRKVFQVKKPIKKATVSQTAHGLYEFWINGNPGTEDKFKPGFTSYHKRLQYQTYDITDRLTEGENVWAVILADGWWRGVTGGNMRNNFGYQLAFLGQLVLEYADGSKEYVISDSSFKESTGGLLESDMKLGDRFDASLEPDGWKEPGFDDTAWTPASEEMKEFNIYDNLIETEGVPVREFERFEGKLFVDKKGDRVIDFGQNIAGYVAMTFRDCKAGQHIVIEHGEDLKDGVFYNENVHHNTPIKDLSRFQCVDYLCRGEKIEHYCPIFSVAGFQYIKITGYDGEIRPGDFTAIAVYSACRENGTFECSSKEINQLVSNSRWSQKGNFLDVPTDCPTRERSPWTGDGQIYAKTAAWFADVDEFYKKWLKDIAAEQCENGKILNIVPNCMFAHNPVEAAKVIASMQKLKEGGGAESDDPMIVMMSMAYTEDGGLAFDGSAGWGDVATILPWTMYQCYGDKQVLEEQYESAKRWVDYMRANARNKNERWGDMPWYNEKSGDDSEYIWDSRYHWGEWLEPDVQHIAFDNPVDAMTKPDPEVPTAFMAYSAGLVSRMAGILGKKEDETNYKKFSDRVKAMYRKYFIDENGVIKEGRQSCHVRAIGFGIVEGELKEKVAGQLNRIVESTGYHLNTGFLSTNMLLNVLADNGYVESAYKILEQEECPGWLYSVKAGATTIPERWDGKKEHADSLNHYSYGAVCDFLFSRCAGIMQDEQAPGYKHFILKPMPGGTLTHAKATYRTAYGVIVSAWEKTENQLVYTFKVPEGSCATIILPSGKKEDVSAGEYTFAEGGKESEKAGLDIYSVDEGPCCQLIN